MKKVGFFNHLRNQRMLEVNGIVRKADATGQPYCRKCNKIIDVVEIKDRGPNPDKPRWFEIYAKCHGEESYSRIEADFDVAPEFWGGILATGAFFDSSHEESNAAKK